ncbi:MAG: putative Na+/H+ antiporter [Bdellovibrionaceae bacterium]|nr:putative Na+/H+ antiporter [Pseudobdellovibrionaceae bacterium]
MLIDHLGTLFFALAVLHTFFVGRLRDLSHRFPKDSFAEGVFHLLGEIEVVFGVWAAAFLGLMAWREGLAPAVTYLDGVNFTEPLFVFVIMAVCSTRPVMDLARALIVGVSALFNKTLRTPLIHTEVFVVLTVGSLAGSLITEPAAMTVAALLLNSMIHTKNPRLLYLLIGTLFVNISIGGSLTPFAAPPILMVAKTWGWDFSYVLTHLGWKSAVAVTINSLIFVLLFRGPLSEGFYTLKHLSRKEGGPPRVPAGVTLLHVLFLLGVIIFAHHASVFMGLFLFFLGTVEVSKRYQTPVRLKESLLVAFFLGGIIVFGPFQTWWLKPLLVSLSDQALFVGATLLTAVTDNAALTFLGSQVESLSESARYALVAGALAGGGLTVIANAPNPAGYSILQNRFPDGSMNPLKLLMGALLPTLVAALCLWLLPSF